MTNDVTNTPTLNNVATAEATLTSVSPTLPTLTTPRFGVTWDTIETEWQSEPHTWASFASYFTEPVNISMTIPALSNL